jgi:anti-sigma factor RsiW
LDAGDATCRELVERATDLLEHALSPRDRLRLASHLERCPGCRAYVAQLRAVTVVLAASASPLPPAAASRARLLAAFRAVLGRRTRS